MPRVELTNGSVRVSDKISDSMKHDLNRMSALAHDQEFANSKDFTGKAGHLRSWLASRNKAGSKPISSVYVAKRRKRRIN